MPTKLDNLNPAFLASTGRSDLSSWLKYRGIVRAAMSCAPQEFSYTPVGYSPSTISSRLREAIRGALAFDYPMDCTKEELQRWYAGVTVSHSPEKVYIRTKGEKRQEILEVTSDETVALSFATLSPEEFHAFALLLNNGRIQGPIVVKSGTPFPSDLPNFTIIPQPQGYLML